MIYEFDRSQTMRTKHPVILFLVVLGILLSAPNVLATPLQAGLSTNDGTLESYSKWSNLTSTQDWDITYNNDFTWTYIYTLQIGANGYTVSDGISNLGIGVSENFDLADLIDWQWDSEYALASPP